MRKHWSAFVAIWLTSLVSQVAFSQSPAPPSEKGRGPGQPQSHSVEPRARRLVGHRAAVLINNNGQNLTRDCVITNVSLNYNGEIVAIEYNVDHSTYRTLGRDILRIQTDGCVFSQHPSTLTLVEDTSEKSDTRARASRLQGRYARISFINSGNIYARDCFIFAVKTNQEDEVISIRFVLSFKGLSVDKQLNDPQHQVVYNTPSRNVARIVTDDCIFDQDARTLTLIEEGRYEARRAKRQEEDRVAAEARRREEDRLAAEAEARRREEDRLAAEAEARRRQEDRVAAEARRRCHQTRKTGS